MRHKAKIHPSLGRRTLIRVPIKLLRMQLKYDPDTGVFRWKKPLSKAVRKGAIAGHVDNQGYRRIGIGGHLIYASRIAWAMTYGEWPDRFIDHVDGNRGDDRISNLRLATPSENCCNGAVRVNNQTGLRGVSPRGEVFTAAICRNRRIRYLGRYTTPEEAHAAYVEAAKELHGEFMNDGVTGRVKMAGNNKSKTRSIS